MIDGKNVMIGGMPKVELFATDFTIGDTDPTFLYGITDVLAATIQPSEAVTQLVKAPDDSNFKDVAYAPVGAIRPHREAAPELVSEMPGANSGDRGVSKMKTTLLTAGFLFFLGLTAAQSAGNVQAGKAEAAACAGCHGVNGQGFPPYYPALAGKSKKQLLHAMMDFQSGKRVSAVMKAIMGPLSDQDMENLAAFYASLK